MPEELHAIQEPGDRRRKKYSPRVVERHVAVKSITSGISRLTRPCEPPYASPTVYLMLLSNVGRGRLFTQRIRAGNTSFHFSRTGQSYSCFVVLNFAGQSTAVHFAAVTETFPDYGKSAAGAGSPSTGVVPSPMAEAFCDGACGGATERRSLQPARNNDAAIITQTVNRDHVSAAIQLGSEVCWLMKHSIETLR